MEDKLKYGKDKTIEYYESNADLFVDATVNSDMSELYEHFEKYLMTECKILDLGCGSGRDSKYFSEKGYRVVAADPSHVMREKTKSLVDITVLSLKAEELSFKDEFDAVWACASLLHVPRGKMKDVFMRIARTLRKGGVCYCSLKYGEQDRVVKGRYFADYTEELLTDVIHKVKTLEIVEMWLTSDVRGEEYQNKWINAIIRKAY